MRVESVGNRVKMVTDVVGGWRTRARGDFETGGQKLRSGAGMMSMMMMGTLCSECAARARSWCTRVLKGDEFA